MTDQRDNTTQPPPQSDPEDKGSDENGALIVLEEPIGKRIETELEPLLRPSNRDVPLIIARVKSVVLSVVKQELFHGPLPHPAHSDLA